MDEELYLKGSMILACFSPLVWLISFLVVRNLSKWPKIIYWVNFALYIILAGITLVLGFAIHDYGAFALAIVGCMIINGHTFIALLVFIILKLGVNKTSSSAKTMQDQTK